MYYRLNLIMNMLFKVKDTTLYYKGISDDDHILLTENRKFAKVFKNDTVLKSKLETLNRFLNEYYNKVWLISGSPKEDYLNKLKSKLSLEIFITIIRCDNEKIKLEVEPA